MANIKELQVTVKVEDGLISTPKQTRRERAKQQQWYNRNIKGMCLKFNKTNKEDMALYELLNSGTTVKQTITFLALDAYYSHIDSETMQPDEDMPRELITWYHKFSKCLDDYTGEVL